MSNPEGQQFEIDQDSNRQSMLSRANKLLKPSTYIKPVAIVAGILALGYAGKGAHELADAFNDNSNDVEVSEFATPNEPSEDSWVENIPSEGARDFIASKLESHENPVDIFEAGQTALSAEMTYGMVLQESQFSGQQDTFAISDNFTSFLPWVDDQRATLRESNYVDIDLQTLYTTTGEDFKMGYYPEYDKNFIEVSEAELVSTTAVDRTGDFLERSFWVRWGQRWGSVTNLSEVQQEFQDDLVTYFDEHRDPTIQHVAMCQGAIAVGAVWAAAVEVETGIETHTGSVDEIAAELSEEANPFIDDLIIRIGDPVNTGTFIETDATECRGLIDREVGTEYKPFDENDIEAVQNVVNVSHASRASVMSDTLGFGGDEHIDADGNVIRDFSVQQVPVSTVENIREQRDSE
ncbi:MAG: hypothetical protein LC687_01670 [Actinobacteria bacterium]|nr:hypothetical protein [Actinomycetota bacterium]